MSSAVNSCSKFRLLGVTRAGRLGVPKAGAWTTQGRLDSGPPLDRGHSPRPSQLDTLL